MISKLLFYVFSTALLLSAVMVILAQNAVYSVLFLVLSFIISASLLILLECEYMAFIFIIIYVGAIAVLFLFVVMMLDLKKNIIKKDFTKYFPVGSFIGLLFLYEILFYITKNFNLNYYINQKLYVNYYYNWFEKIDSLTEIEVIGQILYTKFVLQFLIAGDILLLAVISAVVLTLKTHLINNKNQSVFKQLSRQYKNVLWY
jgi:NADH-quinone oxidoreductase subunit J